MTAREFSQSAGETKLSPASIEIGRSYLVAGLSIKETAKKHAEAPEQVRRIVARICRKTH